MNKLVFVLGFIAIFVGSSVAVTCPDEDENSIATYFPHETECGKFYECHYGQAILLDCPNGTYWDSTLNVCNRNVNCGDLATTTASPVTSSE